MIRLQPITTEQTFSIIPSSFSLEGVSLSLVENGTNISQDDVNYEWEVSSNGNFVEITVSVDMKEGSIHTIKLHTETDILYKDLVYVTSQTDKKRVHSIVNSYTTVTDPDDEYIIL